MSLAKRATAEFLGTFWLVFGGCGSAVLAAGFPSLGIGFAGVALAFGLTVLTMAFAIGHIFRMSLESRGQRWPGRQQALSCFRTAALHHRESGGGDCRGWRSLFHCQRLGEL